MSNIGKGTRQERMVKISGTKKGTDPFLLRSICDEKWHFWACLCVEFYALFTKLCLSCDHFAS